MSARLCGRRPALGPTARTLVRDAVARGASITSVARVWGVARSTLRRYLRDEIKTYQSRSQP